MSAVLAPALQARLARYHHELKSDQRLRELRVWAPSLGYLNLADNDYLELACDPLLKLALSDALPSLSLSSSASPLISGYQTVHRHLEETLCTWHGFAAGLVWNSGFAANQAILSHLPERGDIVFADRLVHHSLITGALRSGAQLIRYPHGDIGRLTELLVEHASLDSTRAVFVVSESVFSMDGDYPDLVALAALKKQYGFTWILDEAHATGWYGPTGAGLASAHGVQSEVDILVGTLGKSLGSMGAYTLFHAPELRTHLLNTAGEFIFSTYLSPVCAYAAARAVTRCQVLSRQNAVWRSTSRDYRRQLREAGWNAPDGDSPIIPLLLGDNARTVALTTYLRGQGIWVGMVRPPTVPRGTSRLRLSLKITTTQEDWSRLLAALATWRGLP